MSDERGKQRKTPSSRVTLEEDEDRQTAKEGEREKRERWRVHVEEDSRERRGPKQGERDSYGCWHQAVYSAHLGIPSSNARPEPRLLGSILDSCSREYSRTNTYNVCVL